MWCADKAVKLKNTYPKINSIADVEEQKKMSYFISLPECFYEINYGLVKGGGRG